MSQPSQTGSRPLVSDPAPAFSAPARGPLAEDFLLDPEVVFLNHGSFGATPRVVFEEYQRLQRELERQPVEFLMRRIDGLVADSRAQLGDLLGCSGDDLVYVTNATLAANAVAHGLDLGEGDEVVVNDHEYGAVERAFRFYAERRGYRLRCAEIALPVGEVAERIFEQVNERTRLVVVSHITSPTGLVFPVEDICRRARERGILTFVDGAHGPGQLDLSLDEVGADFYTGNLHKWLNAPKGAAFLYARREVQERLEPLVVSWGWDPLKPGRSRFLDWHQLQGTRDPSAFLAVPSAIRYFREKVLPLREGCRELARRFRSKMQQQGFEPAGPESMLAQLAAVCLPDLEVEGLKERLYQRYRVEMPVYRFSTGGGSRAMCRIACQVYNSAEQVDFACSALAEEVGRAQASAT